MNIIENIGIAAATLLIKFIIALFAIGVAVNMVYQRIANALR